MSLVFAYTGAGGAGIGILVLFGALTILGIGLSAVYLIAPKHTRRRCADARLAAVLALGLGDLMPLLALVELLRRGVGDVFDTLLAVVGASALLVNSALAVTLFVGARHRERRLRS